MAKLVSFTYVRRRNIAHKEKSDLYYIVLQETKKSFRTLVHQPLKTRK